MNDNTEVSTDVLEAPPVKHNIPTGGQIAGIIPQSIDEAFRVSRALAVGGDMVPKHFQGKPDMILAALMRGAEIGFAPMQSLSNIAVINGRSCLWGDALPALMQRHGHQIDHYVTGEGDERKAVATLIRGDTGQKIVREFSMADAKKAGLAGKAGPWQTYPDRMLAMRARSWACRDGAADAMMGLAVVEEQQDIEPMRDVTPQAKPTGYAEMAQQAREKAKALPKDPGGKADEVLTGQAVQRGVDPEQARKAFSEGISAAADPENGRGDNPYTEDAVLAARWFAGFDEVREVDDHEPEDDEAGDSGQDEDDAGEPDSGEPAKEGRQEGEQKN